MAYITKYPINTAIVATTVNTSVVTSNTVTANSVFTTSGGIVISPSNVSLGSVSNLQITGGSNGQVLATFGNGAVYWSTTSATYGNSNVADYLPTYTGNLVSLTGNVVTSANVSAGYILANGAFLTGLNFTNYSNANVANYLPTYTGNLQSLTGNVTTSANVSANVFLGNGSQLTGLDFTNYANSNVANYLPTYTGNLDSLGGNITTTANVSAGYYLGNGALLTGIAAGNYSNANVANYLPDYTGNISAGNANVTGNVSANYFVGNGSQLTGINAGNILLTSNITSLVAGQQLRFAVDYSNASYTQGIWTLYQIPATALTLTSPLWVYTGNGATTTTKNAYANYAAGTIQYASARVTITAVSSTFSIQSGDYILIGSSNITGASLTALGISGSGGTYTIANTLLNDSTQTTTPITISARLTTTSGAVSNTAGTNLINTQPTPFTVNSITLSWPSNRVPYWDQNQEFNWSVSTTGTVTAPGGNVVLTGTNSSQLVGPFTGNLSTSGTGPNYNSTTGTFTVSANYFGTGGFGAGQRFSTAGPTTLAVATSYYPLFTSLTGNSSNPTWATSNNHATANFAYGNTVNGSNVTSGVSTDYMWMAIPNRLVSVTSLNVTAITQADPGVVTTVTAHGFSDGQAFQITGATGMTEVNGQLYYAKATGYGTTQFGLYLDPSLLQTVDTTTFTAYTGSGVLTTQTTFQHDDPGFPGIVDTPAAIYSGQAIGNETYTVYGFTNFNSVRTIYTVAP